jgi:hypothetical protein
MLDLHQLIIQRRHVSPRVVGCRDGDPKLVGLGLNVDQQFGIGALLILFQAIFEAAQPLVQTRPAASAGPCN